MIKHKALELAKQLDDLHEVEERPIDKETADTIRAQHALIVQMRDALESCEAFLLSAGFGSSDAYHESTAALAAADQYLKGEQA